MEAVKKCLGRTGGAMIWSEDVLLSSSLKVNKKNPNFKSYSVCPYLSCISKLCCASPQGNNWKNSHSSSLYSHATVPVYLSVQTSAPSNFCISCSSQSYSLSSTFCRKKPFSHKTSKGSWGSKASSQAEARQAKLSCDRHSTYSALQQLPVHQCIYNWLITAVYVVSGLGRVS